MFRRSKPAPEEEPTEASTRTGGKGRPTPTRKEAEAAARARARPPRNRKERAARDREFKGEQSKRIRAGMKAGDERYLLPRDKGPVRRFVRDFVDVRFTFAELAIPLMIVALFVQPLTLPLFLVLVVDLAVLRFRLRRQLKQRFPDESGKGTTFYAITRALQIRPMRLPKPQVRIGQDLPERYR